ncbi:hypothetical protein FO519_004602 [Halicephalobus sp. NKZ332]|nr:hypothetical protein FO519_004602 [Halicephalobus sp. NKZ332]
MECQFKIRELQEDDMHHIHMMIKELANFEKMPEGPKLSAENLAEDFKNKAFFGFIAFLKDEPAGMALYYLPYSTWEGVCIHLEDLYIRPQFRKGGLGRKMVAVVCKVAQEKNYKRVQWNVLDWNPARSFYQKLEAENISETEGWLIYRLSPEQISKIASEAD